jgi:hypothetical protein
MNRITRPVVNALLTVFWTPLKALSTLAGLGLAAITHTGGALTHPTPLAVIVAVLAALDVTAWWLQRPNDDAA